LTRKDLDGLVSLDDAIAVTEALVQDEIKGNNVHLAPFGGQHAGPPGVGLTRVSMGGSFGLGCFAVNTTDVSLLYDTPGGRANLLAMMKLPYSNLRITASIAAGAKYLSRPDSRSVGLLGSGRLALVGLRGLCAVRPIKRVMVYSPTAEHRTRLAEEATGALGVPVTPVGSMDEAIDSVDIIAMSTSAYTPILTSEHLRPGLHVNGWGAPNEMDESIYLAADQVALYSRFLELEIHAPDPLRHQADGPLFTLNATGRMPDSVVELGAIVSGQVPARVSLQTTTVYRDARGGAGDAAIMKLAYDRARERGLGTEISF